MNKFILNYDYNYNLNIVLMSLRKFIFNSLFLTLRQLFDLTDGRLNCGWIIPNLFSKLDVIYLRVFFYLLLFLITFDLSHLIHLLYWGAKYLNTAASLNNGASWPHSDNCELLTLRALAFEQVKIFSALHGLLLLLYELCCIYTFQHQQS